MTDEPYKLFDAELRFMEILWANQPVSSGALARLCQEQLGWKRTTTYTVLKKLCTRGLAQNENAVVTALVTRDRVRQYDSAAVVDGRFGGSLPAFLTAVAGGRALSPEDVDEIQSWIDDYRRRNGS